MSIKHSITHPVKLLLLFLMRYFQKKHFRMMIHSCLVNYIKIITLKYSLRKNPHVKKIIAVCLIEHLGDIVACEPIARFLKKEYRDALLVWFVRQPYSEITKTNPYIDRTLIVSCMNEWILLEKSSVFDKAFTLHFPDFECHDCGITFRSRRQGNVDVNFRNYYLRGNLLSVFCQSGGLAPIHDGPCLYITDEIRMKIDHLGLPSNFIVIHGEANGKERNWPREKWIRLLSEINEASNMAVVEIGIHGCLEGLSPKHYLNLCAKLSILETAEVIRRARLFVGIDSGPAHLANAVGTYGIILLGRFGPFTQYIPYSGRYGSGQNCEVIFENDFVANIPVERVLKSITKKLVEMNRTLDHAAQAEMSRQRV